MQETRGPGSHCGLATIEVSEILKSSPTKKILQCLIVTNLDPNWQGPEFIEQHNVGDHGIWVMHPNYSSIDLAWRQEVAEGKYSVVISCKSQRPDGEASDEARPGDKRPVTAWTGELDAPAVELEITPSSKP